MEPKKFVLFYFKTVKAKNQLKAKKKKKKKKKMGQNSQLNKLNSRRNKENHDKTNLAISSEAGFVRHFKSSFFVERL